MTVHIASLIVSPLHRYEGRPSDGPAEFDGIESVDSVEVRAHKGLVGDRYFGTKFAYAAVTIISAEGIRYLEGDLGAGPFDPELARRNIITTGFDIESLLHTRFTIDAGHGPVGFRSITPANPCAWMNVAFAEGAHQALRGHAGLRLEPLTDGRLALGPAVIDNIEPLTPEELKRRQSEAPVS